MRNESFYATAAQIIVTLLIPLVLEFIERGKLIQADLNRKAASRGSLPDKVPQRAGKWVRKAYVLAAVAVVGEGMAISVLIFGVNGSYVEWAGWVVTVALLVTSVAAVVLRVNRLSKGQLA
jgi:hypothetical protein